MAFNQLNILLIPLNSYMMRTWSAYDLGLEIGFFIVLYLGPLAQSVEQQTFNLWVVGSIPTGPTLVQLRY
jgi:hypothetical protein